MAIGLPEIIIAAIVVALVYVVFRALRKPAH
jgi:hypothetical protein